MGVSRRKFTSEFKDEAVRLALSGEKRISEMSRDLGLCGSTLHNWIAGYRKRSRTSTIQP